MKRYRTEPKDPKNPFFLNIHIENLQVGQVESQISQCLRILLIEQGTQSVKVKGAELLITGPAILCLNDGDQIIPVEGNVESVTQCCFHPDMINDNFSLQNIRESSPRDFLGTAVHDFYLFHPFINGPVSQRILDPHRQSLDQLKELMHKIQKLLLEQKDPLWLCNCRSLFIQLLFLIQAMGHGTSKEPLHEVPESVQQDSLVRDVLIYLHSLMDTRITLEELTTRFATNRTTLSKRFKAATGETLMAYLNQIRIQSAARMLRNTDLCPVYIQELAGFRDSSHYHRQFREYYGMTPGQYRDKLTIPQ